MWTNFISSNYLASLRFNPFWDSRVDPRLLEFIDAASELAQAFGHFAEKLAALSGTEVGSYAFTQPAPVSAPTVSDSYHPAGSLKTEGNTVITPGGYKIEMIGQYEWKITGPDGKWTRIWGDPHVDEGDRDGTADWDFKRNSIFMLPDGTQINVTTVPGGAPGMTVTGQLEIINGVDRVVVTDIDKGVGKIGTITQDGHLYRDRFKGDIIRMGRESDDWSFEGREIVGSENGGESFKLGGELYPGDIYGKTAYEGGADFVNSLMTSFFGLWQDSWRPLSSGFNPYYDDNGSYLDREMPYDRRKHMETLANAFRALADMLTAFGRFLRLTEQLSAYRSYAQYV